MRTYMDVGSLFFFWGGGQDKHSGGSNSAKMQVQRPQNKQNLECDHSEGWDGGKGVVLECW